MKFVDKLREPIIANRGLDLLAFSSWLCFAWWGIWSALVGIPSISAAANPFYEIAWGGSIGALALIAALAAFSTFFQIGNVSRITKKQFELCALVLMTGLASVYPAVVITQAFGGSEGHIAVSGIAMYYVLFPVWRILHLIGRIRALTKTGKPFSDATG